MSKTDEALANILTESLNGVKTLTKGAYELVETQAPDLIRQVLLYELWSSIIWGLFFLFLFSLAASLPYLIVKKGWDEDWYLATFFVGGTTLPFVVYNVSKIVKITIAPKVFMIEYIANLI